MLAENQLVEVKWNYQNKEWYESKGYNFTKHGDIFIIKPEDAHPNSRSTKIKVCCDYCGKERIIATQDYSKNTKNGLMKYSCGSKGCSSKKHMEYDYDRKKEQIKKFYDLCNRKNYEPISTIEDYQFAGKSKLLFKCPLHGVQEITLNAMQSGNGCKKCGIESRDNLRRLSWEEVKRRIESVNNNKLLNIDEYINNSTRNLNILCGTCNKRTFTVSMNNYIRESKIRCEYCARSQSNNERIIQYYLEKYNYEYIYNYRFKNCRDKRPLPFDFYLPSYNLCIEYDGEQHFKPIRGKEHFKSTQFHDELKTNYCKLNNINLLRIPYWEHDNIERILVDKIKLQLKNKSKKIKYIPNRKIA